MATKERPLTPKMLAFVEAYDGNVQGAAEKAGISYDYARRLFTKSHIVRAIKERDAEKIQPLIATREERQQFWSETMNNPKENMKNRLKASELLGKSNADFTDKILVGDLEQELKDIPDDDLDKRIEDMQGEVLH